MIEAEAGPPPNPAILVVEDEPLVRMFTSDFLSEAGYKVFEAVSADEAMEMLEARPDVHAVFTDIELPGSMDGLALARAIRDRWPTVALIITSGRKMPADMELPDGAAFISKPYLPETVVALIHAMVNPQVMDPAGRADWEP